MSDYWNHTTLFDVAKEVPLSWQVAAAICSLDSVNTEAVWEEAVESLVPYHRLSKVCEYQIQSLCEVWDQWVNPTLTDPTMVLEILADKVVLLETKRFVPLLPHVMMTVLTQQDESELAIQVAALIKGQASPSRIDKEDHYIQLFLELWAKEDRDGLLNFTRSWTERQLRTQE